MTEYILDWSILRCIFLLIIITRCIDCNHRFAPFGCHSCRRYALAAGVSSCRLPNNFGFGCRKCRVKLFWYCLSDESESHSPVQIYIFFWLRNVYLSCLSLKKKAEKKHPKPVLQIELYLVHIIWIKKKMNHEISEIYVTVLGFVISH